MSFNMAANHAIWPRVPDPIFAIAGRAKEAIKKYGEDDVIDATIGALMNDDGSLVCMQSVYGELKNLPDAKIAAYATIAGQPEYLEAVKKACFREYLPEGYIKVLATPGGTGAIKNAVWNYTVQEEEILVCDWYWSPYTTIAEECGRKLKNYKLFDDKGNFNIPSFKENFNELMNKQKRVFTLINTPAHNPTGYSLSDNEWDEVLNIMIDATKDIENKAVLFVDVAYIDFAGKGDEKRAFFKKFSNLPKNILVIVGFSMSKGYTMYGLRSGALIGISSDADIAEEFHFASAHTSRANWSNGTRGAMEVLSAIENDAKKLATYNKEKTVYKEMLQTRANAFMEEAKKVGLTTLPYRDGFFVSIPHSNPKAVVEELTKYNIFAVSLKMGVRFAVCAVSEAKCRKSPAIIKKVIEDLK